MPSLSAAPPPLTVSHRHHHHRPSRLFIILATSITASLIILLLTIFLLYRKLSRNRTAPSETHQENPQKLPRRFSYSLLRRATAAFSPSNRLGHGGFGSVYKAVLPSGLSVAVKIMDSPGSLQGEREFDNELSIASVLNNPNIVSLLGYSSDRRRRRLILVYELMPNRSLQDALFDRKCPELMPWRKRFEISLSVASALQYLHHICNPPVIHGDIKPSNILLNADFEAKIGDFGLARLKSEEEDGDDGGRGREIIGDNGSILEENESVLISEFEENVGMDRLPDSCVVTVLDSPEMVATPATDKVSLSEGNFDRISVEGGMERKKGGSGRDWWWKQETSAIDGLESGRVKDYVMEWIGNEISKDRPKNEWVESKSSIASSSGKMEQKKQKRRLEWWASLDEGRMRKREKNRKKPREWWKEEFCEELVRKKKKKKNNNNNNKELSSSSCRDLWWQRDEDSINERKTKKKKSSIDWWLDGLSGDVRNGRRNSLDEIPKSGGISSTPSMRGTVCYIAPEYGGGGQISEKCDVYSFGVLLLVLVSGRRPLQVMASPISEFERANLISWARQLARNGKLLDLVDPSIHSLDKEQASVCITIALQCLQRSASKRPSMKEIVAVLSGEAEAPHLPFEFSPSPPSNFLFKSQRKGGE
ncbi:receptor-like serine/threonine-protein kinase At2g45590 [Cucurbita moschata]|uniref:non-specific serine/threonine protein kinase n=1 Tax=Cucurbita moschata TaxID=3662 RepID=A0A6J1H455_CUCMO|nr:receptor-like serine/threonine-protein kinase At2g45590 [Cucurbita moschata]